MRRFLVALAAMLVFAAFLYGGLRYTLHAECEACVQVDGQTVCRSAMAATREQAAGTALINACSILTQNPKSERACVGTQGESLRCREF